MVYEFGAFLLDPAERLLLRRAAGVSHSEGVRPVGLPRRASWPARREVHPHGRALAGHDRRGGEPRVPDFCAAQGAGRCCRQGDADSNRAHQGVPVRGSRQATGFSRFRPACTVAPSTNRRDDSPRGCGRTFASQWRPFPGRVKRNDSPASAHVVQLTTQTGVEFHPASRRTAPRSCTPGCQRDAL